jgi:hypothetical protein
VAVKSVGEATMARNCVREVLNVQCALQARREET